MSLAYGICLFGMGAYILYLRRSLRRLTIKNQKQQKEVESLLDILTEGVVVLDLQGKILQMNVVARQLLGHNNRQIEPDTALGIKSLEVIAICQDRKVFITDSVCVEKGRKKYFDLLAIPYEDKIFLLIQDKSSEQKVMQVGKDFIANASHELKTPITIIRGFAETLLDMQEFSKDMLNDVLEKVVRNCKRMDALVRNLLTLSDIENIPLINHQPCDLMALVEESKRVILSAHPDVKLDIVQGSKATADVDASILELAILNVLENAVKYSPKPAHITVFVSQDEDQATVAIQDRGVGIALQDLEHIFDRFYTVDKAHSRKLGGAGLGLSLVKTIVEKHEGAINVKSVPGEGSTFTLTLPRFH